MSDFLEYRHAGASAAPPRPRTVDEHRAERIAKIKSQLAMPLPPAEIRALETTLADLERQAAAVALSPEDVAQRFKTIGIAPAEAVLELPSWHR